MLLPAQAELQSSLKGGSSMSKGNSGLFKGTLGTTRIKSSQNTDSYSERGVEIVSYSAMEGSINEKRHEMHPGITCMHDAAGNLSCPGICGREDNSG